MYTETNYKSKKEMIKDFKEGKEIRVYQPGPFSGNSPRWGVVAIEGPHYPKPHKWYASVVIADCIIKKILS